MDQAEAIRLLNEDIRGEHGAIILYLRTAYALRGGEMSASIESIARDEMRHYKWLAHEVVRLGGTPTTERDEMDASDVLGLLRLGIQRESDALGEYEAHAQAIGDRRIVALLDRISQDEQVHDAKIRRFIGILEAQALPGEDGEAVHTGDLPVAPPEEGEVQSEPGTVGALQGDVQAEYTTLLQYLHQSFLTPACPLGRELEAQAIIGMKHMGWLSEFLADSGISPRLEHGAIDENPAPEHILAADIQGEQGAAEFYRRQIAESDDPKLSALLQRILDHSLYHEIHLNDLLADIRTAAPTAEPEARVPPPAPARVPAVDWTIGSLLGRRQE